MIKFQIEGIEITEKELNNPRIVEVICRLLRVKRTSQTLLSKFQKPKNRVLNQKKRGKK